MTMPVMSNREIFLHSFFQRKREVYEGLDNNPNFRNFVLFLTFVVVSSDGIVLKASPADGPVHSSNVVTASTHDKDVHISSA